MGSGMRCQAKNGNESESERVEDWEAKLIEAVPERLIPNRIPDRFLLTKPNSFLHNRNASVARHEWY